MEVKKNIELMPLFKDDEDQQFSKDLFCKTTIHADRFTELISSKTNNWEIERIAQVDLLFDADVVNRNILSYQLFL